MKFIDKRINKLICIIAFIMLLFLTLDSFFRTSYMDYSSSEITIFKWDNFILNIIFVLIFIIIIYYLNHKITNINVKKFTIILLLIHLFISIVFIIITKGTVNPKADSEIIFNIAKEFTKHNYSSLQPLKYLYRFPYQISLTIFEKYLIIIFKKNAILSFQIINAILTSLAAFVIVKIFNIITDDKYKDYILIPILIFSCFNLIIYNCFIYGNSISFSLYIFSIYFWILYLKKERHKLINSILSIFFISISYCIKSTAIIPIVMIIFITFLDFIISKRKCNLIYILALIVIFSLPIRLSQNYYEYKSGYEKSNGIPKIGWIAMGTTKDYTSSRTDGWYNAWHVDTYLKLNGDNDKYIMASKNKIIKNYKKFIQHPKYCIKFFYKKISSQWNNPTYQSLWSINPKTSNKYINSLYKGKLQKIYYSYANIYQIIIFVGALLYLILDNKRSCYNIIFFVLFIGGFIFYSFWEAKSQYVFQYFVILIPYSGAGWLNFIDKLTLFKH